MKPPRRTSSSSSCWWNGEAAVRISALPSIIPPLPDGRRVSVATCWRWSLRGLGGIKLRRFKVGAVWHTTREEVTRWSRSLTSAAEVATA
ncbi:MAG: hypothetical protein WAT39_12200 [Planctomycetota bacterium]